MEATVTISIKEYDQLRNDSSSLQKILKEKKQSYAQINTTCGTVSLYTNMIVYDPNEIQQFLIDRIKTLEKDKSELYNELYDIKKENKYIINKTLKKDKKWFHFF